MNCPNCGSQTTSDQKFCRSCGRELGPSTDSYTNPRLRLFRVGFATMFLGLLVALTGSMLLHLDVVKFVGLVGMITGMFIIGYAAIGPSRSPIRVDPMKQPEALPKAETTRKLVPMDDSDFVPSVTERTTNLLETSVSNPNKQQ